MKKVGAVEETATHPQGASTHFKIGGLRAKSLDRSTAGYQWQEGGDWDMAWPLQRDWAAFTSCGDSASDAVADSAVYFSAGRMAGDTFDVRAVVDVDEVFDVEDEAAPDGAPGANRSNIVKIVNWRCVPIVANWIVGATTTPVSIPPLTAEYKRAAMLIEPAPGVVPTDVKATWVAAYQAEVAAQIASKRAFVDKALNPDPGAYAVQFVDFVDYWQRANPDAGFFGTLWERVKTFFGDSDEQKYKVRCDNVSLDIVSRVMSRIPIPDNGLTVMKFDCTGPHNQNPYPSFVAGVAPAIASVTSRTKAVFFEFTRGTEAATLIHEVGHTLFLSHAPGHFHPPEQPGGCTPTAHDRDQICLMSYHPDKKLLCGLCLLKLGGRDYLKVGNDGTVA